MGARLRAAAKGRYPLAARFSDQSRRRRDISHAAKFQIETWPILVPAELIEPAERRSPANLLSASSISIGSTVLTCPGSG